MCAIVLNARIEVGIHFRTRYQVFNIFGGMYRRRRSPGVEGEGYLLLSDQTPKIFTQILRRLTAVCCLGLSLSERAASTRTRLVTRTRIRIRIRLRLRIRLMKHVFGLIVRVLLEYSANCEERERERERQLI